VALRELVDERKWIINEFSTPMFTGGPFVIWGLTGYLLHKFINDVVNRCSIVTNENSDFDESDISKDDDSRVP